MEEQGSEILKNGTILINLSQFNADTNNANPTSNWSDCSMSFTTCAPIQIVGALGDRELLDDRLHGALHRPDLALCRDTGTGSCELSGQCGDRHGRAGRRQRGPASHEHPREAHLAPASGLSGLPTCCVVPISRALPGPIPPAGYSRSGPSVPGVR